MPSTRMAAPIGEAPAVRSNSGAVEGCGTGLGGEAVRWIIWSGVDPQITNLLPIVNACTCQGVSDAGTRKEKGA